MAVRIKLRKKHRMSSSDGDQANRLRIGAPIRLLLPVEEDAL